MQVLLKKMQEDLKSNGYTNRKLATRFKVTHTTVNGYFKKENKFDFMHFVDSLRLYKPGEMEFIRKSIERIIPSMSHKNLKLALEVLDMYGEYDLQQLVMDKIQCPIVENDDTKKKGNSKTVRTNLKLVEFYKLLRKRSEGTITRKDFFAEVNKQRQTQKNTENEVLILSDLSIMYSYLDMSDYQMVDEYAEQIIPRIHEIPKHTLEDSFLIRIEEMKAIISMHRDNDLDKSREICFNIINNEFNYYLSTKAIAYCKLGESYALTDYEKAKMYLEKSLEIIGEPFNKKITIRREKILNILLFLKLCHKKELDTINPNDLDLAELAFYYTRLGKNDEAINILKSLEKENGFLSSFQLYYMGLAVGGVEGKEYFEKSVESFSKKGDFFYISLPQSALKCYN